MCGWGHLVTDGRSTTWDGHKGNKRFLKKGGKDLPYDLVMPLLGIYPKDRSLIVEIPDHSCSLLFL